MFLPNPPIAILELSNCLSHKWLTFLKRCYWLVRQEYKTNKNIDNDLYCNFNVFPNLLFCELCTQRCSYRGFVWKTAVNYKIQSTLLEIKCVCRKVTLSLTIFVRYDNNLLTHTRYFLFKFRICCRPSGG